MAGWTLPHCSFVSALEGVHESHLPGVPKETWIKDYSDD